jgi:intracellular multiplication protein IcmE
MENFKTVSSNPRTRMVMLATAAILIALIVIGFVGTHNSKPQAVTESAKTDTPPTVDSTPGTSTDPTYHKLQKQSNDKAADEAEAQGHTSLPVLVGANLPPSAADPVIPTATNPLPTPSGLPPTPAQPAPVPQSGQPPSSTPPTPPEKPVSSQAMQGQVTGYLEKWGPGFKGGQEFNYVGAKATPASPAQGSPAQTPGGQASGQNEKGETASAGPSFVRAGTIIPALLLTPIDSTKPGPVLAQITTGPLAGSRLIGQFQASENSVAVVFNTISNPAWDRTYKVNAFAVGPDASPGLATSVNRHSFKKYASLLAGAFLAGMGDAISQSATTTTIIPNVGISQTGRKLSTKEVAQIAVGKVGMKVAEDVEQRGNQPPTIKVQGQNGAYPIGLLFLENF